MNHYSCCLRLGEPEEEVIAVPTFAEGSVELPENSALAFPVLKETMYHICFLHNLESWHWVEEWKRNFK